MYIILTIFKAVILIAGLGFTMVNFFPGISGDKIKLKKAGIIFLVTFLVFIVITVLEFTVFKK
jgi:hypothetical protein